MASLFRMYPIASRPPNTAESPELGSRQRPAWMQNRGPAIPNALHIVWISLCPMKIFWCNLASMPQFSLGGLSLDFRHHLLPVQVVDRVDGLGQQLDVRHPGQRQCQLPHQLTKAHLDTLSYKSTTCLTCQNWLTKAALSKTGKTFPGS